MVCGSDFLFLGESPDALTTAADSTEQMHVLWH